MSSSRWSADRLVPDGYPGPGMDLPVLYGDLDTNNHVNNVMMGRFFENARVVCHHDWGVLKSFERGGSFLIARVAIDYVRVAHFGHPLHVRTRVARIGSTSFVEEQAAWQSGRCVALAEVIAVHTRDEQPRHLPVAAREILERFTSPMPAAARSSAQLPAHGAALSDH